MRKRFINDIVGFLVMICLSFGFLTMMIICFLNAKDILIFVISSILFGGGLLVCIIWLFMCTEVITIYNDHLSYRKATKLVKIMFSDITKIEDTEKITYGLDGCKYSALKISDKNDNVAYIISDKFNKKYIDFIQSQL